MSSPAQSMASVELNIIRNDNPVIQEPDRCPENQPKRKLWMKPMNFFKGLDKRDTHEQARDPVNEESKLVSTLVYTNPSLFLLILGAVLVAFMIMAKTWFSIKASSLKALDVSTLLTNMPIALIALVYTVRRRILPKN